jgi:hypothetical protein
MTFITARLNETSVNIALQFELHKYALYLYIAFQQT